MAELSEHDLKPAQESLLRDYLASRLDEQVGLAETRFRQHLAEKAAWPSAARPSPSPSRLWIGRWTFGLVGAALAASLAAIWAGPSLRPIIPVTSPVNPSPSTPVGNPYLIQQDVQSQTFDDGMLSDGDRPVHILRRRDLQRTRWFDKDDKLQNEQVVPSDHLIYVPLKTY